MFRKVIVATTPWSGKTTVKAPAVPAAATTPPSAKPARKKAVKLPSVPSTVAAGPRRSARAAGNGAPRPASRRPRPAKSVEKN